MLVSQEIARVHGKNGESKIENRKSKKRNSLAMQSSSEEDSDKDETLTPEDR